MEKRYELSSRFSKQYSKADSKIQKAFSRRFQLFRHNPKHSVLKNHQLKGAYKGFHSINITGDWRALYTQHTQGSTKIIEFKLLGTHSQLYR